MKASSKRMTQNDKTKHYFKKNAVRIAGKSPSPSPSVRKKFFSATSEFVHLISYSHLLLGPRPQ